MLVVGVLGVFFTLYNRLTALGGTTSFLTIGFVALAFIAVAAQTGLVLGLRIKLKSNRIELESLKQSIKQSQEKEKEKVEVKEEVVVDVEAEAKALLPSDEPESIESFAERLFSSVAQKQEIVQGIMFLKDFATQEFSFAGGYAYYSEEGPPVFSEGETLPGQAARNREVLNLSDLPPDYITILSGLGRGTPRNLLILPILNSQNECIAVAELASFKPFGPDQVAIYQRLGTMIAERITSIENSTQE